MGKQRKAKNMALINFQERFAEDVKSGIKRQTIRKQRKYPIKLNETLYLYKGLRTKKVKKLRTEKCKSVDNIKIDGMSGIYINGERKYHYTEYLNHFAEKDGFSSWKEMYFWFSKTYGLPFEGILIKW